MQLGMETDTISVLSFVIITLSDLLEDSFPERFQTFFSPLLPGEKCLISHLCRLSEEATSMLDRFIWAKDDAATNCNRMAEITIPFFILTLIFLFLCGEALQLSIFGFHVYKSMIPQTDVLVIYKFLSNIFLPRILSCKIFYLP